MVPRVAIAHFTHPLVVRRRDDLKRMAANTDGLVFDDMDFSDWTPEDVICLLDMTKNRSVPARYSDSFIEADIPMIFTSNKKPKRMFPRGKSSAQRRAILRRFTAVRVTDTLARIGRPFTTAELNTRREAGRNGPRLSA